MSDTPIYDALVVETGTNPEPGVMTAYVDLFGGLAASVAAWGDAVSAAFSAALRPAQPRPWWDVDEWEDDE